MGPLRRRQGHGETSIFGATPIRKVYEELIDFKSERRNLVEIA
jgi:hypothetical protein